MPRAHCNNKTAVKTPSRSNVGQKKQRYPNGYKPLPSTPALDSFLYGKRNG